VLMRMLEGSCYYSSLNTFEVQRQGNAFLSAPEQNNPQQFGFRVPGSELCQPKLGIRYSQLEPLPDL
jgi:hypothetical protein